MALAVLAAFDGASIGGFAFQIANLGDDGRRGDLIVDTPFGRPRLGAKVELARHQLSLEPEFLNPIELPIHDRYDFTLAPTPTIRVEEAVSEKLARYRRVPLARDLYDLQWFATGGAFDEALVRRLWALKVYRDIVVDHRGSKPFSPNDVLRPRAVSEFHEEDIGYLTKPVRIDDWIGIVRNRYDFLTQLNADERRWLDCNERHRHDVEKELASFRVRNEILEEKI